MKPNFERHKLIRFIKTQGRTYTFISPGVNQFGEPTGSSRSVEIPGVYHEIQEYVINSATDGSNIKTKPESYIMCLIEDSVELTRGMEVVIQNKSYKIVDLRDVNNLGVACNISLEVVLP